MAYITKDKLKELIDNAPPGIMPAEIVAGLRERGHDVVGFRTAKRETTLEDVSDYEKKNPNLFTRYMSLVSPFTSPETLAAGLKIAKAPQAIATTAAKTIGGVVGGLSTLTREGVGVAGEALKTGFEELVDIPKEIGKAYIGGITKGYGAILSEDDMQTPSKALGLKGAPGLIVDIAGDPLNLLFVGPAQKAVIAKSKKAKPLLERFGIRFYQSLFKPAPKKVAKEFKALGKAIKGVVKEQPELLGEKLAKYGIKGSVDDMLKMMNQRISVLGPKIAKTASRVKTKIKLDPIITKLDDLANSYQKAGRPNVAKSIRDRVRNLLRGGKELSVDDAVELRRIYDDLRLTAGETLSEAHSIEQRIYKIISDGLRGQIDDIPTIGALNKEFAAYKEGLLNLSKIGAKEANRVLSPITLREFFPYLKVSVGPFARTKTAVGQAAIRLSEMLGVPTNQLRAALRTIAPATAKHLLED